MKQVYQSITTHILALAVFTAGAGKTYAASPTSTLVPAGTTLNWNSDLNSTQIEVYGTLNFTPGNINGNWSNNTIVVYNGGIINLPSGVPGLHDMIIDIRSGGTMNINASSFNFYNNGGIINAGTLNASSTAFTLSGSVGLQNSGLMNVKKLEIIDGAPSSGVQRKNTGSINITEYYLNRGNYENATLGVIKVTGPCSGGNCGFANTDQGITNQLTNNGTIDITGPAKINGPMTLNGTMIVSSDLTITKPVTGTNGKLGVTDGVSSLSGGDAKYTGTNMLFCDKNSGSINNNFDYNTNQNQKSQAGIDYTINCVAVYATGAPLPLKFIAFEVVAYNKTTIYFKWTTTEEYNVATQQLQGSVDGINYEPIENVYASNTSGTHYYTSSKIEASRYAYYRIAVIDKDGKKDYSKIVSYKAGTDSREEATIYPNPIVNNNFNVQVPGTGPTLVKIFTNDGRLLFSTSLTGQQKYQVSLPAAASQSSLLAIQVIYNGSIKSFRVINRPF